MYVTLRAASFCSYVLFTTQYANVDVAVYDRYRWQEVHTVRRVDSIIGKCTVCIRRPGWKTRIPTNESAQCLLALGRGMWKGSCPTKRTTRHGSQFGAIPDKNLLCSIGIVSAESSISESRSCLMTIDVVRTTLPTDILCEE